MKKLFSVLLSIFFMFTSLAQQSNFGAINYTVPAGYELIKNDNVLTYFKENKSTGAYCNFFIYQLMDGKGSSKQCFDFCWENLLQKPFKITAAATLQPENEVKGWKFLLGNAAYAENGVSAAAMQITFTGENKMQNVIILCNSPIYQKDIEDFIGNADMAGEAGKTSANNASSSATPQPVVAGGKAPVEVWMKSAFEYDMMKRMSLTKYEWTAIYADGKFHSYMPSEGFAGMYEKNKDWGKASWSGNRLNVTDAGNNVYYFEKKTATTMQRSYDSQPHYYKCVPVDGLRIEGAYTQYATAMPSPSNEAQYFIIFNKDGTFNDRGIYVTDLKNPYILPDIAPGKGKYEIINYSIFLRYDDGRIKQAGFSGFLDNDPKTMTDAYFIGRNLYYRKDNGHNSNLNNIGK